MGQSKHYREPIRHTCPQIDDVIERLNNVVSETSRDLEDLRKANDMLRQWGIEEAEKVDELDNENDKLRKEIKDLETDIENYKYEIKELEKQISQTKS